MARADFHTHTRFSPDGLTSPQRFVARCLAAGLTDVAVTDHRAVDGAYAVAALAPFRVIIGQEVRAREGDLLGLFLEDSIPDGLPASEAAHRIHGQGGLVVVPHPFSLLRRGLGAATLRSLGDAVDAIEGYNGRMLWPRLDTRARAFARDRGLPCTLGSDAHTPAEVGRSWVDLPAFDGPSELLKALPHARFHPARPAPWLLPLSGVALVGWAFGRRPAAPERTRSGVP